ncbi:MAG: Na/Pi cotransporter family protein, partial [Clostridia bacterium]|nr:Na/Pi cotransporter family protein [Clostridia bacterium]
MNYIFDILLLIGGLSLFLFGMNIMGEALERRAGSGLKNILGKMTTHKFLGFLTGLAVTAIIQSSSATTVMVVGFVNSGLMTLGQAINVIMGANVGTTITAWILSLGGISSSNVFVKLLKPTSFTPVLALIGIVFYMFTKSRKKKDTGTILLGFATLMFGMDTMSDSVAFLEEIEGFRQLFVMFQNPILGVLAGALLTAILQSSSASVGILQALANSTSSITYGSAIPIIMGQNIGTCVTALISSVGTNKNARRAAFVHLSFNVIGSVILLSAFSVIKYTAAPAILSEQVGILGIPLCHSAFNLLCTGIMFPMGAFLEKLAHKAIPDSKEPEKVSLLDERLLATPSLALARCRALARDMAKTSHESVRVSLDALKNGYTEKRFQTVKDYEEETDRFEDELGTYLVKLSSHAVGENESAEAAMMLRVIGDYERIADHSVNLIESAEELKQKGI